MEGGKYIVNNIIVNSVYENIVSFLSASLSTELEQGGNVYTWRERSYLKNFASIFLRPNQGMQCWC